MNKKNYIKMQKLAGFKVGDKVKVISKCPDYHMGWSTTWDECMKVGETLVIEKINDYLGMYCDDGYYYPFFVLEKANDIKIQLNSDYEAIVTEKEVIVGCQKFTHDKILEVASAIKEIKRK